MDNVTVMLIEFGTVLVVGFFGAWLLKKIHVPQVLGFILTGLLFSIVNQFIFPFCCQLPFKIKDAMGPITTIALGVIGFNIGAELKFKELKKIDKRLLIILVADSIGTFLIVSTLVYFLTNLSFNFSIILGALASATAPAATADVLWEYKAKGPLTQAVLFILAVDDIVSILLVQITEKMAKVSILGENISALQIIGGFFYEVGVAIGIGLLAGLIIVIMINKTKDNNQLLELVLGMLILIIGIALMLEISAVLAAMTFGIIITSFAKIDPSDIFHDIFKIGSPVVATFFVIIGLSMNLLDLAAIGLVGLVYLVGRTIGKVGAVSLTAKVVKAPKVIQRYLGVCLFSQAGVALGLAAKLDSEFQGTAAAHEANLLLTAITGTILIVQLLAPLLVKWAIHKAGEVGNKEEQEEVAIALMREKCNGEGEYIIIRDKNGKEVITEIKCKDPTDEPTPIDLTLNNQDKNKEEKAKK